MYITQLQQGLTLPVSNMCTFTVWQPICPCAAQQSCVCAHKGQATVDGTLRHYASEPLIESEACPCLQALYGRSVEPSRSCHLTPRESRGGYQGDPIKYVFRYPICDDCFDKCRVSAAKEDDGGEGAENSKDNAKLSKRKRKDVDNPWFVVFGKSTAN